MDKIENLKVGLETYKEQIQRIDTMSLDALLNLYGNLKILEYRAFGIKQSDIAYSTQHLEDQIQDKINYLINKK